LPHDSLTSDGCRDCGRFLLDASGTFGRPDVTIVSSSQPRPSNAEVDGLIERAWIERLAQAVRSGKKLYDGLLCRLISHRSSGRRMELTIGPVSFKEFVGTNCANPHLRYKYGPEVLANPLGVSAVLVTADGFLVMGRRSEAVVVHSGMIHPIGGMVELHGSAAADPFAAMEQELGQELALPAGQIAKIACLGLVRDKSLFQSELIFRAAAKTDVAQILKQAKAASDAAEHSELLAVRDEPCSVVNFIQSNCQTTTAVALASLMLHGQDRWGSGWFATARGYLRSVV
jgi:hypothetical protein